MLWQLWGIKAQNMGKCYMYQSGRINTSGAEYQEMKENMPVFLCFLKAIQDYKTPWPFRKAILIQKWSSFGKHGATY